MKKIEHNFQAPPRPEGAKIPETHNLIEAENAEVAVIGGGQADKVNVEMLQSEQLVEESKQPCVSVEKPQHCE